MSGVPAELEGQLRAFVRAQLGADADVRGLGGFAGSHGGLTYGFEVCDRTSGALREALVIRLAPRGVRHRDNTDVYRQAPLLRCLRELGLPVPAVRFAGRDTRWFGVPYVIVERLPGRSFVVWEPDPSFDLSHEAVAPLWRQAAAVMAQVHRVDWERHLASWQAPTPIEGEVERWDPILAQAPEEEWIRMGKAVREDLRRRPPPPSPVGLLHGDCQPGNILYDEAGRLVALLDWEMSAIAAQLYDLGWLLMFADRTSWHESWCPASPLPASELIAEYEARSGRCTAGVGWYQALSNYKMAVVAGLYTKLHRSGRRPDPSWEKMALAIPRQYARARELLEAED